MGDPFRTGDGLHTSEFLETPFGDAFVIPIKTFVDTVLPPIPRNIQFDALVAEIEQYNGCSNRSVSSHECPCGCSPGSLSHSETESAFTTLRIFAERVARAIADASQTFSFHDDKAPGNVSRSFDYVPDASFRTCEDDSTSQSSAYWHSIAVPGASARTATKKTAKRVSLSQFVIA